MRISDWSSDVCSSDLRDAAHGVGKALRPRVRGVEPIGHAGEAGLGAARRTTGRALQVGQGGRGTAGVAIDHDGEFFERCHQAASSRPWRALLMSLMVARSSRPVFLCPARSYWMRKSLICAFFDFFERLALAIVAAIVAAWMSPRRSEEHTSELTS